MHQSVLSVLHKEHMLWNGSFASSDNAAQELESLLRSTHQNGHPDQPIEHASNSLVVNVFRNTGQLASSDCGGTMI